MAIRDPITLLRTHEVENQPPPLEDYNAYDRDPALQEALAREGAGWAAERVRALGDVVGSEGAIALGHQANRHGPELRVFDRYGHRIDEIEYHPAYHELMRLAIHHELPSIAWTARRPGGHAAHAALVYLFTQVESGVCCPTTMTYAVVPALRHQPEIAAEWEPRILSTEYDPRCIPAGEKRGVTMGMAMTEKQGGSDVRANTTRARALAGGGPGGEYELTGHKWFCSAPMCDAFLTLAYTGTDALSCFFVPRWRPDGHRNRLFIQRLKDKVGNRSNASSEIEYDGTWARMVGDEGQGVRTIIDMVHHTRLDTVAAAAGLMRQAVLQAAHHAAHRRAFGRRLIEQPLMQNVLADLALDAEAATAVTLRVARAFDEGERSDTARVFARLATAVCKYWLNKRAPAHVVEALECHGGAGYVEESMMGRLYREAPLNGIWEGSGNVICLDVLRTIHREPGAVESFFAELDLARGCDRRFDRTLDLLHSELADRSDTERRARRLTEAMALALQGALLLRHAPAPVAEAFCVARLGDGAGNAYGTLPPGVAFEQLIERVRPASGD
jgi:putative acyl-CoA dehydrogenase